LVDGFNFNGKTFQAVSSQQRLERGPQRTNAIYTGQRTQAHQKNCL